MYVEKIAEFYLKEQNAEERRCFSENILSITKYLHEVSKGMLESMQAKTSLDGRELIMELESINAGRNRAHDALCESFDQIQKSLKRKRIAPYSQTFSLEREGKIGTGTLYSKKNHEEVASFAMKIGHELLSLPGNSIDTTMDSVVENIKNGYMKDVERFDNNKISDSINAFVNSHKTMETKEWFSKTWRKIEEGMIADKKYIDMTFQNGGKLKIAFDNKNRDNFCVDLKVEPDSRFLKKEELFSIYGKPSKNGKIYSVPINYINEIAEENGKISFVSEKEIELLLENKNEKSYSNEAKKISRIEKEMEEMSKIINAARKGQDGFEFGKQYGLQKSVDNITNIIDNLLERNDFTR